MKRKRESSEAGRPGKIVDQLKLYYNFFLRHNVSPLIGLTRKRKYKIVGMHLSVV